MLAILFKNIHLYLDPGSGSLIAQLLAGGLLGIGLLVRIFWAQIKGIFTKKNSQAPSEDKKHEGE